MDRHKRIMLQHAKSDYNERTMLYSGKSIPNKAEAWYKVEVRSKRTNHVPHSTQNKPHYEAVIEIRR